VQVNVDANGLNVPGDAANEPSLAVDPTDPNKMAIGWRQFDTIASNFRQAGVAYTIDGGLTWTFPGVLDPGQFRSDPVLGSDADGNFYYCSLSSVTTAEVFKSIDGGITWMPPVTAHGGDKEWIAVDQTLGIGSGNIYEIWNVQFSCCPPNDFTRSTDGGGFFESPVALPLPSMKWGTMSVGPDGALYLAGATLNQTGHLIAKSTTAQDPASPVTFDFVSPVDLGGVTTTGGPNPAGLLGQVSIATDHSGGPTHGNVYMLGSVDPPGFDPLNVMFIRSTDGGASWSAPVRVNDDLTMIGQGAWHWFGTMSVAPNGRIDVVWNDTRNDPRADADDVGAVLFVLDRRGCELEQKHSVDAAVQPHAGLSAAEQDGGLLPHGLARLGGQAGLYGDVQPGAGCLFSGRSPRTVTTTASTTGRSFSMAPASTATTTAPSTTASSPAVRGFPLRTRTATGRTMAATCSDLWI